MLIALVLMKLLNIERKSFGLFSKNVCGYFSHLEQTYFSAYIANQGHLTSSKPAFFFNLHHKTSQPKAGLSFFSDSYIAYGSIYLDDTLDG